MQAYRQPVVGSPLEYPAEIARSVRSLRSDREKNLNKARSVCHAVDLSSRQVRKLAGNDNRGAKTWIAREPGRREPLVHCGGKRSRCIGIVKRLHRIVADNDRVLESLGGLEIGRG